MQTLPFVLYSVFSFGCLMHARMQVLNAVKTKGCKAVAWQS